MIAKETYERMKQFSDYGGSWAIWDDAKKGHGVKSGVGNLSIFNQPDIHKMLNSNYVFVGLNGARHDSSDDAGRYPYWRNFHSADNKRQQDYKLRYALHGTKYWGSYMTDAIKCFKETDSSKVRLTIDEEIYHAETLRRELKALGGNPVLVGLGVKSYAFLKRHFGKTHKVVKVMHYSYYIGLGKYRNAVLGALKKF